MVPDESVNKRGWKDPAAIVLLIALLGLLLVGCTSGKQSLSVGDQAPSFTLPSTTGGEVSLSDYVGQRPTLLFFHMADG